MIFSDSRSCANHVLTKYLVMRHYSCDCAYSFAYYGATAAIANPLLILV